MKLLLLLAFVAVAAAMVTFESKEAEDLYVGLIFTVSFGISTADSLECIHKTGVTLANVEYWKRSMDLEDSQITDKEGFKRTSCALVCCAQKIGIMIGTEIQLEKMFEFIAMLPVEVHKILRESATVCKEQVSVQEQKDECLVGYDFFKCITKRSEPLFQQL